MDGSPTYGNFDPVRNIVYLNWHLSPDGLSETLLHELFHALLIIGGGRYSLLRKYCPDDILEEDFCRLFSPILFSVLSKARWLKFPKFPKCPSAKAL